MGLFHTACICAQPLHALIFPYNTFGKSGTKFKQYVRQHEWSPHNIYRIIIFPSKWWKGVDSFFPSRDWCFFVFHGRNSKTLHKFTTNLTIQEKAPAAPGPVSFFVEVKYLLMAGSQHDDKRSVRVLHSHERGAITRSALPCTICCCINRLAKIIIIRSLASVVVLHPWTP